ncbi:MAG: hypothetical protein ACAH95_04830 [Fimbriimonas sp.]
MELTPAFPVIGYDARDTREVGPVNYGCGFLLKDVTKPLSVDDAIWWSVFDREGLEVPEWRGPRQNNWENLAAMQACAVENHLEGFRTIAITQMPEEEEGAIGSDVSNPGEVQPGWEFLGYDVADYFLLSGLMNCGYTEEEMAVLCERFGDRLNQNHLFTSIQAAEEFMLLSDERVPEHAPFYVFGLYLIP